MAVLISQEWLETRNPDERYMGRELLAQTKPLDHAEDDSVSDIMAAASPSGSDGCRYSKWSK